MSSSNLPKPSEVATDHLPVDSSSFRSRPNDLLVNADGKAEPAPPVCVRMS